MTSGIVGDLCCEVQWIGLRIQAIGRCLDHARDPGLIARLQAEMDGYAKRCLEIRSSLSLIRKSVCKGSIQVCVLEELLCRCLAQQTIRRLS
jgi:hypothetical protein